MSCGLRNSGWRCTDTYVPCSVVSLLALSMFASGLSPAAANGDCFLVQRYGELIDMFNAPVDPNTTRRTYLGDDGRFYRAWSLPEVNEILADNGITEEHIDRFDAGECR